MELEDHCEFMIFQLHMYWMESYKIVIFPLAQSTENNESAAAVSILSVQIFLLNNFFHYKRLELLGEIPRA